MRTPDIVSQNAIGERADVIASRRAVVCSLGVAMSTIVTGSVLGGDQDKSDGEIVREQIERDQDKFDEIKRQALEARRKERRERLSPEKRALEEQLDSASTIEERQRVLQGWHVRQTTMRLREELGVSAEEWTVIQPRIADVFSLLHAPTGAGGSPAALRVAQVRNELLALLLNKEAKPEEIKAKLTALRMAKEQARRELAKAQQDLRKIMTLRQEAVLVLYGLLE